MARIKNYINNERLMETFVKYKADIKEAQYQNKQKPRLPNYIAEAIMKISEGLAKKSNWSSYSYKSDMISDAMLACVKYVDNFDPEKYNNPFAYITQIAHNAFLNRLDLEQKQAYTKAVIAKNNGSLVNDEHFNADSILSVIEVYENKMRKRREKAAERTALIKAAAEEAANNPGDE